MNASARALYKQSLCMKTAPGQSDPKNSHSGYAFLQKVEKVKGQPCFTGFADKDRNPMNKRKSPWRGANRKDIKQGRD